jgi:valyl-tRNA synthetase
VDPAKKCAAVVLANDPALRQFLQAERATLALLGRVDDSALTFPDPAASDSSSSSSSRRRAKAVHLVVADGLEADLPMDQLVDAAKERTRLAKQLASLEKDCGGLAARLASSGFLRKASAEVVAETQAALAEKTEALAGVRRSLADLD